MDSPVYASEKKLVEAYFFLRLSKLKATAKSTQKAEAEEVNI